jgi:transcriptional regulator with XRE-family HTH domain
MTNPALDLAQMTIAERLQTILAERGKQQKWLALRAGLPKETVSRIVTGKVANPGIDNVQKIAAALGESVGSLLGETNYVTRADLEAVTAMVDWGRAFLVRADSAVSTAGNTPLRGEESVRVPVKVSENAHSPEKRNRALKALQDETRLTHETKTPGEVGDRQQGKGRRK